MLLKILNSKYHLKLDWKESFPHLAFLTPIIRDLTCIYSGYMSYMKVWNIVHFQEEGIAYDYLRLFVC